MILKEGKVLLGQRHPDPVKASSALHGEGTWTMPGGKLEFQEGFEDGAVREVLEETGMHISKENLKVISLANDRGVDAHFVTIGLLYDGVLNEEPQVAEPDVITQWKWFDLDALPSPMFFPSQKVLDNYRAEEFYGA